MIICPRCKHSVTVLESFAIVNPFDFGCPACSSRLQVGRKGEMTVWASGILGSLLAAYTSHLWTVQLAGAHQILGFVAMVFLAMAIPFQWVTVRYADALLRRG